MLLPNYFIIPIVTILVATIGTAFVTKGKEWYETKITKSSWIPSGSIIGIIWSILYILSTIAALAVWNTFPRGSLFSLIIVIFLVNAVLNCLWPYLFFYKHKLYLSIYSAVALEVSVLILIILVWPVSTTVGLLLIPYALWVIFALFLTYSTWRLNH